VAARATTRVAPTTRRYNAIFSHLLFVGMHTTQVGRSEGEQVFEVEREVGKTGNDERLAFLEVF
jgi:hypothetical protein